MFNTKKKISNFKFTKIIIWDFQALIYQDKALTEYPLYLTLVIQIKNMWPSSKKHPPRQDTEATSTYYTKHHVVRDVKFLPHPNLGSLFFNVTLELM